MQESQMISLLRTVALRGLLSGVAALLLFSSPAQGDDITLNIRRAIQLSWNRGTGSYHSVEYTIGLVTDKWIYAESVTAIAPTTTCFQLAEMPVSFYRIGVIAEDTNAWQRATNGESGFRGIASDGTNFWAVQDDLLKRISPTSSVPAYQTISMSGTASNLMGLTFNGSGNLCVVSYSQGRAYEVTTESTQVTNWPCGGPSPAGITYVPLEPGVTAAEYRVLDSNAHSYVTSADLSSIGKDAGKLPWDWHAGACELCFHHVLGGTSLVYVCYAGFPYIVKCEAATWRPLLLIRSPAASLGGIASDGATLYASDAVDAIIYRRARP